MHSHLQFSEEEWKHIRDGGKLCQIYASPQFVLEVVQQLDRKGIAFWITDPLAEAEIEALLDTLETLL
jgi:hypothetical protein